MDKELNPGSNKMLFPSRKTEQELLIFKEIFVEPKERELQKFKQQTDIERKLIEERIATLNPKKLLISNQQKFSKNTELNHSNMLNTSQHSLRKTLQDNFKKAHKEFNISDDEEDEEEKEPTLSITKATDQNMLKGLVKDKQSVNILLSHGSFFVQQIHVQPPEGLNATVAAPLTPGGGWAPSIPHVNPNLMKTSLKDLTIRAKAGVQAGDIQKEAHMAYNLALLNEENKHLKKAIRFYKRFFF